MLRRLLERPCTLALLVGCQFAFVAYFSLGGFRNLTSLFGRAAGPVFDYSRTHDVYANLSRLLPRQPVHPDPAQPLPFCPERSPFLGECGAAARSPARARGRGGLCPALPAVEPRKRPWRGVSRELSGQGLATPPRGEEPAPARGRSAPPPRPGESAPPRENNRPGERTVSRPQPPPRPPPCPGGRTGPAAASPD